MTYIAKTISQGQAGGGGGGGHCPGHGVTTLSDGGEGGSLLALS